MNEKKLRILSLAISVTSFALSMVGGEISDKQLDLKIDKRIAKSKKK